MMNKILYKFSESIAYTIGIPVLVLSNTIFLLGTTESIIVFLFLL
jgi:hypothetical protein